MKKRIVSAALTLLIIFALTFAFLPAESRADSSGLCFLAINDSLPELGNSPVFIGGATYIPASALSYFGVYCNYFASSSTALIYTGSGQLYFDMSSGGCYDGAGSEYSSVSAIYSGGAIYVPALFVCGYFGISCSYISGVGYGDVVRLTNGGAVLSDSYFLEAATSLMQTYYNAYYGINTSPTPGASPTPSPSPSPSPDRGDTAVYISFEGFTDTDTLDLLSEHGVRACFFLTAEDVRGDPDMVRRLIGCGQRVGVLCSGRSALDDYQETSSLIFDACQTTTLFVTSTDAPGQCRDMAEENGLIFWTYELDAVRGGEGAAKYTDVTSAIASSLLRADVRFSGGGATPEILPTVLSYLANNKFDVRAFSETEPPLAES